MGFGLLFIGYFIAFLMSVHPYGWITQIIGFYIIFRALTKLFEYKHSVSRCLVPLVGMTVCQALSGLQSFIGPFRLEWLLGAVSLSLGTGFHFLLLRSIKELAEDVEDSAIARLTARNGYVVGFYFLLNVVVMLLPKNNVTSVLYGITMLASLIYPLFMLHLLFCCYRGICAPEDKDMEQKPSRFAFINKRREMRKGDDQKMDELVEKLDKDKNHSKK